MSRSERLLDLIQTLRSHRYPVSALQLAEATNVSVRTLYRDIASLRAQGAVIEGEPGVGYVLRPGFLLPPLMFTPEEIDALVLGAKWVERHTDQALVAAIGTALSKIASVLPVVAHTEFESSGLFALTSEAQIVGGAIEADKFKLIRAALRRQRKILIEYRDRNAAETIRTVWPVALGYFDHVRLLLGWCEIRQDYRRFRVNQIVAIEILDATAPRNRQVMLREWLEKSEAVRN